MFATKKRTTGHPNCLERERMVVEVVVVMVVVWGGGGRKEELTDVTTLKGY